MQSQYDLNDENFLLLAAKAYEKPSCVMSEFESDLKRVKYIKRLIRRYKITGDLKERLILNHIIVLGNMFGPEFTCKMLFYKIDEIDYDILKTFMVYLNFMPDLIVSINNKTIRSSDILMDYKVIENLRKI